MATVIRSRGYNEQILSIPLIMIFITKFD